MASAAESETTGRRFRPAGLEILANAERNVPKVTLEPIVGAENEMYIFHEVFAGRDRCREILRVSPICKEGKPIVANAKELE